jgi:hypothetical protein
MVLVIGTATTKWFGCQAIGRALDIVGFTAIMSAGNATVIVTGIAVMMIDTTIIGTTTGDNSADTALYETPARGLAFSFSPNCLPMGECGMRNAE